MKNREIKFRAWIIQENKMSYQNEWFGFIPNEYIQFADQGFWVNNLNASEEHKSNLKKHNIEIEDEFILSQFTGLHDKNGKEIYEGDLIKWADSYMEVIFKQEACQYWLICKSDGIGRYKELEATFSDGTIFTNDSLEVIGNVFENPEILSDKH